MCSIQNPEKLTRITHFYYVRYSQAQAAIIVQRARTMGSVEIVLYCIVLYTRETFYVICVKMIRKEKPQLILSLSLYIMKKLEMHFEFLQKNMNN